MWILTSYIYKLGFYNVRLHVLLNNMSSDEKKAETKSLALLI